MALAAARRRLLRRRYYAYSKQASLDAVLEAFLALRVRGSVLAPLAFWPERFDYGPIVVAARAYSGRQVRRSSLAQLKEPAPPPGRTDMIHVGRGQPHGQKAESHL